MPSRVEYEGFATFMFGGRYFSPRGTFHVPRGVFMFKAVGSDREFPGFRLMQASCDHWHFHVQMMMFEFKGTFYVQMDILCSKGNYNISCVFTHADLWLERGLATCQNFSTLPK